MRCSEAQSYILILYTVILSFWECEGYIKCEAGDYYSTEFDKCVLCPGHIFGQQSTYSPDGAVSCTPCQNDEECMCDTTNLDIYNINESVDITKNCSLESGTLECSQKCYSAAAESIEGIHTAHLSAFQWVNCSCMDAADVDKCTKFKRFANSCFRNDCDKYVGYLDKLDKTSLLKNGICTKECYDALTANLPLDKILQCNCYYEQGQQSDACSVWRGIYENCKTQQPGSSMVLSVILGVAGGLACTAVLSVVLLRACSICAGRQKKRNGDLSKILQHIIWKKVELLSSVRTNLDHESVYRIPFSGIKFEKHLDNFKLFKRQNIVLKLFKRSRFDIFKKEVSIMSQLRTYRDRNIVHMHGFGDTSITDFLETLGREREPSSFPDILHLELYRKLDPLTNDLSPGPGYILLNNCNAKNLRAYLREDTLDLAGIMTLGVNMANALACLQENRIVHNDLKPENIFVKKRKKSITFVLGDFGMSQTYSSGERFDRIRGGTEYYKPPEWCLPEKHYNPRDPSKIDIYQYALILWETVTHYTSPGTMCYPYRTIIEELTDRQRIELHRDGACMWLFTHLGSTCRPSFATAVDQQEQLVLDDWKLFIERCWHDDVGSRPCARELAGYLDSIPTLGETPSSENLTVGFANLTA